MPPRYFGLETTIPKTFLSERSLRGKLLRELQIVGKSVETDLKSTTKTWENHYVEFDPVIKYPGGEASLTVTPSGDEESVNIWWWLNDGTNERWAVLDDWVSKTQPGRLESGKGRGGIIYRGRGEMMRHGYGEDYARSHAIQGREWLEIVFERNIPKFDEAMRRVSDFIADHWMER